MVRFLPIACLVAVFLGGLLYFRFFKTTPLSLPNLTRSAAEKPLELRPVPASASTEERVQVLEQAVTAIIKRSGTSPSPSSDAETRISNLEKEVTDLQAQVSQLKQGTAQTAAQTTTQTAISTPKSPAYIPLAWVGASSATDWTAITGQTMIIDPADYSGYTSMQFEVSLRDYQSNGMAYARLGNKDDGTAVLSSQVSTTSGSYTWVSSGGFTLPGKKTYTLQLKSLTGYEAGVQSARIKVNF